MKTLAEFKRALTIGSVWKATYKKGDYVSELGIREVELTKSVCVGFKTDSGTVSYLYYPKASQFFFEGGRVEIRYEDGLTLTYEQVKLD